MLYVPDDSPAFKDELIFYDLRGWGKKDAIVIYSPSNAASQAFNCFRSRKTLKEHIEYIQANNIKKAHVVAEDIQFLKECPSLEYLGIYPAKSAGNFDYSPIYELPNIKWLRCQTAYGEREAKTTTIDYSHFKNLRFLQVLNEKGHLNVGKAGNVVSMSFYEFPNASALTEYIPGTELECLSITLSTLQSLEGIEKAPKLERLELSYIRRLTDISALWHVGETLRYLEIDRCGKIKDFSVLKELHNLEFLIMKGSNVLPDLSFLQEMPKLKVFHFTMNVEDGDLSWCESLPYARIQNRRHYSHKNEDLPKNYTDPDEVIPFKFE